MSDTEKEGILLDVQGHLDQVIKEVWLNEIRNDYNTDYLLLEDSVKCAFYFHLRNRLGDGWLSRHRLRIYPEYHVSKKRKVDIAIVQLVSKQNRLGYHLRDCIETELALIEFKHKQGTSINPFINDRNKLRDYAYDYPSSQLYAYFIHENHYSKDNLKWFFDGRQARGWAKGRVTELLGYWDQDTGEFVSKVIPFNNMNIELTRD